MVWLPIAVFVLPFGLDVLLGADYAGKQPVARAHSVSIGRLPEGEHQPESFGAPARRVKRQYGALLIGVRRSEAHRDQLNLPDEERLEPDVDLIYLAQRPVLPGLDS